MNGNKLLKWKKNTYICPYCNKRFETVELTELSKILLRILNWYRFKFGIWKKMPRIQ